MPIFHFDFYRIERREELERLGFEDYLQESGVVVVEWADRFPDLLPDRTRWLRIAAGNNNERFISEGE
jgi:tRNA threonylcarbamoyladenosine biosynthesis protein TsaE